MNTITKRKISYKKFVNVSFIERIDAESVTSLLERLDEIEDDCAIILYVSSRGGVYNEACRLIYALNNAFKERLRLVAYRDTDSAMFTIFIRYGGEKVFLDFAESAVHRATREIDDRGSFDPESYPKWEKRQIDRLNTQLLEEMINLNLLTPAELKKYNQGKEVYLEHSRLQELTAKHMESLDFEIIIDKTITNKDEH